MSATKASAQFDQIDHDIRPYFALPPAIFQSRVDELAEKLSFAFNITIHDGTLYLDGERGPFDRAQDMAALIRPFAHLLPDLRMYASDHDKGNIVLGQDQYDKAIDLVSEGLCAYHSARH